MTRLYQQLCNDPPSSATDLPPTPRKTVDLKAFLNVRRVFARACLLAFDLAH